MVYGTTLRMPVEFFMDEDMAPEPQLFLAKLREHMRKVRSATTAQYNKARAFAHKTLHECSHVFVRVESVKKPCEQPYEGPYEVVKRTSDRVNQIKVNGSATTVSTERLKPAFFEQPNNQPSSVPDRVASPPLRTYPAKRRVHFATQH